MVIKRIYNNNVAMVEDEGVERIAIGRGITFGRSRGDELDTSAVEKVFTLDDPDSLNRLERLIKGIPSEYLSVAEDIVAMLRAELGSDVDDNVLIARPTISPWPSSVSAPRFPATIPFLWRLAGSIRRSSP